MSGGVRLMGLSDRLRIYGAKLGNAFFGMGIFLAVVTLFSAFSPLLMALYLFLLVVPVIITLGTVFILIDGYKDFFSSSTEAFAGFSQTAYSAMPYFAVAAAVLLLLAGVLLFFDPRLKKNTAKIAVSAVFVVLTVVIALFSRVVLS